MNEEQAKTDEEIYRTQLKRNHGFIPDDYQNISKMGWWVVKEEEGK